MSTIWRDMALIMKLRSPLCRSADLLDAVGPALLDAVLGPHVVGVLRQLVHQQLLAGVQLHLRQLQGGGLVAVGHHVAVTERQRGLSDPLHTIPSCTAGHVVISIPCCIGYLLVID